MKHERLFALAFDGIDDLRIAARAERRHDNRLRLAASEHRGAMGPRQHADLHIDRPHGLVIAAIDAGLARQDTFTHDAFLEA